jgi:hypothetical protein
VHLDPNQTHEIEGVSARDHAGPQAVIEKQAVTFQGVLEVHVGSWTALRVGQLAQGQVVRGD